MTFTYHQSFVLALLKKNKIYIYIYVCVCVCVHIHIKSIVYINIIYMLYICMCVYICEENKYTHTIFPLSEKYNFSRKLRACTWTLTLRSSMGWLWANAMHGLHTLSPSHSPQSWGVGPHLPHTGHRACKEAFPLPFTSLGTCRPQQYFRPDVNWT